MAREIRISIDDDEVFERMKARKRTLDLSWEEVLHRGLRRDQPRPGYERGHEAHSERTRQPRQSADRWDAMADSIESEIQSKVYDTIRRSFGAAGIDVPEDSSMDHEMASLEQAEDAELHFPGVGDAQSNRVPLRVNLRTGPDGLDIEVVAVRSGKSVRDLNTFSGGDRAAITKGLAGGDAAVLSLADGEETYRVRPVLEWGRDDQGRPTVRDVEIPEVVFDGD